MSKWETINVYKVIAKVLQMLHYGNVLKDGIVDLRVQKVSY